MALFADGSENTRARPPTTAMKLILIAISALVIASVCSAADKVTPGTKKRLLVSEEAVPAAIGYEILESIELGKKWYGGDDALKQAVIDRARALGADALVEFHTWHRPSGFSWAAPFAAGKAIRFTKPSPANFGALHGEWK